MAVTYALVVVFVAAVFEMQFRVLASPPNFRNLQLNVYNQNGENCTKLVDRRNLPSPNHPKNGQKSGQRPGSRDLEASIAFAKDTVARMSRLEANLARAGVHVHQGSPAHSQLIDSYPGAKALSAGHDALIAVKASLYLTHSLCRRFGLSEDRCAKYISTFHLNTTSLGEKCASSESSRQVCGVSSKYRSLDGSCNHLLAADLGAAFTGYSRLAGPEYGDAMHLPREDYRGRPLPSARLISSRISQDGNKLGDDKTLALVQWTEFVGHDMAHTPTSKMTNSQTSIMCCSAEGSQLKPRYVHPSCLPVHVADDDPAYAGGHVRCLNYVRSVAALRKDCTFGPLEQMNQASHFIDASMIYGTTSEKARSLRQFLRGKLIDSSKGGRKFLPNVEKSTEECLVNADATVCYKSGDVRVNSHPHLTLMYTVWHREHNRIAAMLGKINPEWDDETVYQETRRIVIAEIQHITFNEWMPIVLGEKLMKKLGLKSSASSSGGGFASKFDERVDPSVSNSFSSGALRFVESFGSSTTHQFDDASSRLPNATLDGVEGLDKLIRGLVAQNTSDIRAGGANDDVARSLAKDTYPYGLDIVSLDIQRGRDHGLPGYNKFRKLCGLSTAMSFDQFQDVIPRSVVEKLRTLYGHPNDVDLIVGGTSERAAPESLLGPTFRCIMGEQFARSLKGDRFFYDLQNQPHSFTPEQLRSLKKVTLARILCDNGDAIDAMQPDVFSKPTPSNELVKCTGESRIPRLDLGLWRTLSESPRLA